MKLSVLIGTYNRLDLLRSCLASLIGKIKTEHEIYVIDAGSDDGTLEFLESSQDIILVRQRELLGQAKSLNQVIYSLDSDYVCWLSDDNVLQPRMLDVAVKILNRDDDIGLVSLKVKDVIGPNAHSPYIGSIWPSGILNCNQGVLPTTLMQQVGGFDEKFRDYGIDADLTTKVLLKGKKVVYTKKTAILHSRDHVSDGWADSEERKKRLDKALNLYQTRYKFLLSDGDNTPSNSPFESKQTDKPSKKRNAASNLKKIVVLNFQKADTWIANHMLSLIRDIEHIRKGRYISKLDLFLNILQPYYLVQKIPQSRGFFKKYKSFSRQTNTDAADKLQNNMEIDE